MHHETWCLYKQSYITIQGKKGTAMYCTILCNTVHCTILLYSSSCSSNLMKIIQYDPSPSPRNATCNQERGCSHHCGDRSTASVLNQRSTALESWRLEKCPGNSLKKLEKTAVFRRAGIPICQIAGTANANKVPAHFLYILLVTQKIATLKKTQIFSILQPHIPR